MELNRANEFDLAVWRVVASIPAGGVMSYGEVARAAGFPRHARMVSRAMARSPTALPWQRVVRADRSLAFSDGSEMYARQRHLLEQEGVVFRKGKAIPLTDTQDDDFDIVMWGPPD